MRSTSQLPGIGYTVPIWFFALSACVTPMGLVTAAVSAQESQLFSYSDIPVPKFADRGESQPVGSALTVRRYDVSLGMQGGYYDAPGMGGKLILLLPPGEHGDQSLSCVVAAERGLHYLWGGSLDISHTEEAHIVLAEAGLAVVAYELDGPNREVFNPAAEQKAFAAVKASCGGLVNARNAFEYVLQKVPEVNPKQVYAYGTHSAASHALLFAEHEPRLAGAIAYRPRLDLVTSIRDYGALPETIRLPGFIELARKMSPLTHLKQLKCPTLLFHETGDRFDTIEPGRTQVRLLNELPNRLKEQGTEATLVKVDGESGKRALDVIPTVSQWIREKGTAKPR